MFLWKGNALVENSEPTPSHKHIRSFCLHIHLTDFFDQPFLQLRQPIVFPMHESFLGQSTFQTLQPFQEIWEDRVNGILYIVCPHL